MLCVICLHSFSSCFLFHCMSHGVSGQNIKLLSNAGGKKECVIKQRSYLIISYKIICALLAADICRNLNLTFKYQGQSRYCLVCEKENKTSRRKKKKYHIWQRRRLATGSAFSPIFHDTHWTLNARRHRCECVCVCVSLSMHVWARIRSCHTAYKMYLVWLGAHSVAAAF